MRKVPAALAVLVAGVLVLYTVNLGHAPIYLHEAEVLFALHAQSIATTLHDTNGRLLPLYFQMPQIGDNVWFHPMVVYLMVPWLKILPMSEMAIRIPSVLVGLTDVVLIYFIAVRIFRSERWALLAAGLLALTPSHFMHSRMAMDYLYPVPFVLAWLLCLLTFLEHRQSRTLFAATSFLGVGVYSYIASTIMMPLYLAITLIVIWATVERPWRWWLIAVAGFAWPLCLLVWFVFYPQMIVETLSRYGLDRGTAAPWPKGAPMGVVLDTMWRTARLSGRFSQYWSFFDPAYLFLTGGFANVVNSTRHVGVFPMSFIALVPIGAAVLLRRSRPIVDTLVLVAFASAPLAACLAVPEPYAIDRELELLPFGVLIAVAGARHLTTAPLRAWRAAGVVLLAAVPLHFVFFTVDYYRDYPKGAAFWFNWNSRDAIAQIIALEPQWHPPAIYLSTHHVSNLDAYWRLYLRKYGREDLLPRTALFDSERFDVPSIQPGSLLLVGRDDTALAASIDAGLLRRVASIPEPADPPFFSILVRTPMAARMAELVTP
jgi:4-amino-4-deoxy-L-arabinose transferase-like glycosyltransferase